MTIWAKVTSFLSEMVFPGHYKCLFCGKELPAKTPTLTCEECGKKLPEVGEKFCLTCGDKITSLANYCMVCKNRTRQFDMARAPFLYEGAISHAIVNFKFHNAKYFFKPLSAYLAKCYYEHDMQADLMLCVPMTEQKQMQRGYNQAAMLAKYLSDYIHVPFDEKLIKKIKSTSNQVDLSFEERSDNVKGAFLLTDRSKVKNKVVLLVDDVLTTGATSEECAKLLKKAGAKKVLVLCLARTHVRE